jgi:hypothetical protein
MKLPELNQAFIETPKITAYLLSEENSGGKSAFFTAFGFTLDQPEALRQALLAHAQTHEVASVSRSSHGMKYIIEGELHTPDGRFPQVRSVWIIDTGKTAPRFVTAYPLEGEST